jgi:opacity protein-like surface antigen
MAASYKQFGILADLMYLKVSPSYETPGPLFKRTDLSLEQTMLNLVGTYRILEGEKGWLSLNAGARYMNLNLGLTLQPGRAPGTGAAGGSKWWDAVGGFRGQYNITDRLFTGFLADIGAGDSKLTWQALVGLGYRFNDLVHLSFVYRYLSYDYQDGGFVYDLDTQGLALGLGFTF